MSERHLKLSTDKTNLIVELDAYSKQRNESEAQIKELEIHLETAKTALLDHEKIVDLETKIASLENERSKLEKGKPCNLCGSKEHPLVEKYNKIEVLKSKEELELRKQKVEELTAQKNKLDNTLTEINTQINSIGKRKMEINTEIESTLTKTKKLDLACEIDNPEKISMEQKKLETEISLINNIILTARKLQHQKDEKDKTYQSKNEDFNLLKTKAARLSEKLENLSTEISSLKEHLVSTQKDIDIRNNTLASNLEKHNFKLPAANETTTFIQEVESNIIAFNTKYKALTKLENQISELDIEAKNISKQTLDKQKELETITVDKLQTETKLTQLTTERASILPLEISANTKRTELQNKQVNAKETLEQTKTKLTDLLEQKLKKDSEKESITKDGKKLSSDLETNNSALQNDLKTSIFESKEEVKNALLSKEDKEHFALINQNLESEKTKLDALETQLSQKITAHKKRLNSEIQEDEAIKKQTEDKTKKEVLLKRSGEIKQRFESDNEIKNRNKSVFEEIEKQEKQHQKWVDLIKLIGGSKDAFNTYVQRLTLQNLIGFANIHLYKLNKRYSLKINETYKPGEELNFKLTDHYQTDETRSVDTSSGGEKFLISLALALGLSDLASNTVNIDSLFIDEGFGTLDSNTLETVISTLETLQAQGKMIGIISHVENLKERIPTQIQVSKRSNGVSVVDIVMN